MSFVAAGVGSCAVHADVLTGVGSGANNDPIPAGHGSNAEIALTWSPDTAGPFTAGNPNQTTWDNYIVWPNGSGTGNDAASRGFAYQIDGRKPWISFAPIAGFQVSLQNFDLNNWSGGTATDYEIRVFDGSAPGADGTELLLVSGTVADAFGSYNANQSTIQNVALNFTGAIGQTLTVEFRQLNGTGFSATGGGGSYLAMDNFVFQAVPEPGTFTVLGLVGLGASMMRRRRS